MTIWKFHLALTDFPSVMMPAGAEVLSVAVQDGVLCLWAIVDPEANLEPRTFAIVGTGNPMPEGLGRFIGTVLMPPFVWHVFE